jgi:hypothetical protein
MSEPDQEWHYIDQDGIVRPVSDSDIRALFAAGKANPETLVWRAGWEGWKAVREVPELAAKPAANPAPPALRPKPSVAQVHAPLRPPESIGRRPMPTIDEDALKPPTGSTLRPPGAVPPPPRAVPPADLGFLAAPGPDTVRIVTPIDDLLSQGTAPDTVPPVAIVPPPSPPSAPQSTEPAARARAETSQALVVRLLVAVAAMSLVAGALAIVAIVLILTRGLPRAPAPVVAASAPVAKSSSSGAAPARTGCRLLGRPERLASPVEATVPAVLAPTPDGKRVAVGFARSEKQVGRMTVELQTLRPSLEPSEIGEARILGVVPVVADGHLEFAVDTAQAGLASPRTVARELLVGARTRALARTLAGGKTEELWPLPRSARITTPSAASLPGVGYALAFRSGGQSGKIHLGWLGPDGARKSELGTLEAPGLVGTPSVSAQAGQVLLTYAARASETDHWGIRLATARFGEPPRDIRTFDLPAGGPGVEAISPSATSIPGGGWLLQWTEGATGNRQVRAQALAATLGPTGSAVTLSPTELNAGQGAVLDLGGRALVVFMVIAERNRELWGASVACSG